MVALIELDQEASQKHTFNFVLTPPIDLSKRQLSRQRDPVALVETVGNSEETWKTIERAAQFHLTYATSKPAFESAQDIVQVGRMYAAGYKQTDVMEACGVDIASVRISLGLLHRVMTWCLTKEQKIAIGLSDAPLNRSDQWIASRYDLYHDLPEVLSSDEKIKKLFNSNPLFQDVITKISEGKQFEDIVKEAGVSDFFSVKNTNTIKGIFYSLFSEKKAFNKDFFYPRLSHFMQRFLFAQYVALKDSMKNKIMVGFDEAILENAIFLASTPIDRLSHGNLFLTKQFIKNTPAMERILVLAEGKKDLPVLELSIPLQRVTFFEAYDQAKSLPFVYWYIYEKIAHRWSPRLIAQDMRKKGVPYSQYTLERQIRSFLNFSENILLATRKIYKNTEENRIKMLNRDRTAEMNTMVAFVRKAKEIDKNVIEEVSMPMYMSA